MIKKRSSFTLLELLVVIAIIGLLSAVGLASYTRAQMRARDARRQADFSAVRSALEIYYSENNRYPRSNGTWVDLSGTNLDTPVPAFTPTYIKEFPVDPGGNGVTYRYRAVMSGGTAQGYCLSSRLETATAVDNGCTVTLENQGTGAGQRNFGVGNP